MRDFGGGVENGPPRTTAMRKERVAGNAAVRDDSTSGFAIRPAMRDVDLRVIVDDRRTTFVTVQDAEPLIEHNAMLRTMEQTKTDGLKHLAQIPENIINMWLNEEWAKGNTTMKLWDEEFEFMLARKLADPENAKFLVAGPSHRLGWTNGTLGFGS